MDMSQPKPVEETHRLIQQLMFKDAFLRPRLESFEQTYV